MYTNLFKVLSLQKIVRHDWWRGCSNIEMLNKGILISKIRNWQPCYECRCLPSLNHLSLVHCCPYLTQPYPLSRLCGREQGLLLETQPTWKHSGKLVMT